MVSRVLIPPISLPVSLRDLRAQAVVDGAEEELGEGDFSNYLRANARRYDGPHGLLKRALITQTLQMTFDAFPPGSGVIQLPGGTLQAIEAITYVDLDGVTQTISPDAYQAIGIGNPDGGTVRPVGGPWPETANEPEAVKVTYRAGYGDTPADVPLEIRQAYAEAVTHWKTLRQSGNPDPKTTDLPDSAKTKLDKYKMSE